MKYWRSAPINNGAGITEDFRSLARVPAFFSLEANSPQLDRQLAVARLVSIQARAITTAIEGDNVMNLADCVASHYGRTWAHRQQSNEAYAESTLRRAGRYPRTREGNVNLLSAKILADDVKFRVPTERGTERFEDARLETIRRLDYVAGVAVAVWQLGFVDLSWQQGSQRFSGGAFAAYDDGDSIWPRRPVSSNEKVFRVPFDAANPTHHVLAKLTELPATNPHVELVVDDGRRQGFAKELPSLSLGVINLATIVDLPASVSTPVSR